MLKFSDFPGITMTMRFEGLSIEQLAALHEAIGLVQVVIPEGKDGEKPEKPTCFTKLTKSEMKPGQKYTVLIEVGTVLNGWIYSECKGEDSLQWGKVRPSREKLGFIFDALGILPEEQTIERLPRPKSHGG